MVSCVPPQDPLSYSPTERHWGPQGVLLAFAGFMSHPKGPHISLYQLGHHYYCQFLHPSLIRAREILTFHVLGILEFFAFIFVFNLWELISTFVLLMANNAGH